MKFHIFVLSVIILLLFTGCNKSSVEPISEGDQQPLATKNNASKTNSTEEMPQVPEEWKGKTIKEMLESTPTANSTVNATKNQTINPSYKVEQGTYIVEARKTLSGMIFFPDPIKIKLGETVRWINALDYQNKQAEITIYSYLTGKFRSTELKYGEYFEHTFNEKGNFTYNALPYQAIFQRGTVVVG